MDQSSVPPAPPPPVPAGALTRMLSSIVAGAVTAFANVGVAPADRLDLKVRQRRAYGRGHVALYQPTADAGPDGTSPAAARGPGSPAAPPTAPAAPNPDPSTPPETKQPEAPPPPETPAPPPPGPGPPDPDRGPDFPPVSGPAPAIPLSLGWQYAAASGVLAIAAWLYIRSVWPGALTPDFDHNAWEAAALLHGHIFTPPPPAQLDMMHYKGHWASFFPPLPAFLLIPLVWAYHGAMRTPVKAFCALLGTLCPLFVYQMAERAGLRLHVRLWLTALFAFGTVFWYSVDTGTPWYYVQVCTVFFYLLALRESFGRNRPALVGSLFGAALLCRNPVALGIPFLFWRERRLDWRRIFGFLIPVGMAVAIQLWWNWARTGNPLDTGYSHILMGQYFRPSFAEGMFSLKHLPYQLYTIFFMAPGFHGKANFNGIWPYLNLQGTGQSLLLTTPAFLFALDGDIRRRRVWLGLVCVLLTALPELFYYANGTGQFGVRFSLDYTPLLMALLIFGIGRRFRWQHGLFILASIFLSGYGAVYAAHIHLVPIPWLVRLHILA